MNQKHADIIVAGVLAVILFVGIVSSAQLVLADDPGMGHMDSVPVLHFVGPVVASLVVATLVGGMYLLVRDSLRGNRADQHSSGEATSETPPHEAAVTGHDDGMVGTVETGDHSRRHPILDVLPDDEERILEPVIDSPGITQVEVRDRSGFSRSKVSQTVTDLEKRGLLYRERQGRTYRIYPADDLDERV